MSRPPRVPELRLPRTRQPMLGGTLISVGFHGFLLFLVVWMGRHVAEGDFRTAGGPGPVGGGGGGGGSQVRYLALPPYVTTSSQSRQEQEQRQTIEVPMPQPTLRPIPAENRRITIVQPTGPVVPAAAIGSGPGSGGGSGAGTGIGGGVGSGQGTGVGSGSGPGTGGDGGDNIGPRSRQMLMPPDAPPSVKGKIFNVRFWIDEQGRVTRIEVEPRIPDSSYRREFNERMREYRFYPALNATGEPIASYIDVSFKF